MSDLMDKVRNHTSAHQAGVATMAAISAVQDFPKDVQVHALTAAFKLMVDRLDVPISDLFQLSQNLMDCANGFRPEFKGAKSYMENEIPHG